MNRRVADAKAVALMDLALDDPADHDWATAGQVEAVSDLEGPRRGHDEIVSGRRAQDARVPSRRRRGIGFRRFGSRRAADLAAARMESRSAQGALAQRKLASMRCGAGPPWRWPRDSA